MFVKSFMFSKLAKTPTSMTETLNEFLKDVNFKFATQSENSHKGSLIVSIYYNLENVGKVSASVIKSGNAETLDQEVQKVIEDRELRFSTQSFAQGNIYSICYTQEKTKSGGKKAK